MPKKVDHDERKDLIFKTALDVFAKTGYHDTNLSIIAQNCHLSRTTVYEYFKDKTDLFQYGIKKATDQMLIQYTSAQWEKDDKVQMLSDICHDVIGVIDKYCDEICNFITVLKELDIDVYDMVRRRSAKLKLALGRIIRTGIENGQIKKINAENTVADIFVIIESYCFQMAYFGEKNTGRTSEMLDLYLKSIRTNKN